MHIRKAQIDDLSQIQPLMEELGYPQSFPELEKRFKLYDESKGYGVVVAEQSDTIVGLIAWSQSFLFVSPTTRIHIEGLVVSPEVRGQGVASKLLRHIEEYAQSYTPCIIDLTSGLRRNKDGTHEFYAKQGYSNEGRMEKVYLRKYIDE